MADIGASVLAKLRNKAKETGRSNQLCMGIVHFINYAIR